MLLLIVCTLRTSSISFCSFQEAYLDVVVPPKIDDHLSTGDVSVAEGKSVELRCYATGTPKPEISWRKMGQPKGESQANDMIDECTLGDSEILLRLSWSRWLSRGRFLLFLIS